MPETAVADAPGTVPAHLATWHGAPAVVVDADWLDVATAPPVAELVDRVLDGGADVVAVDLSRCPCCDCYGAGVLARLDAAARARGASLVLTGAGPRVRRVVDLAGLRGVLRLEPA